MSENDDDAWPPPPMRQNSVEPHGRSEFRRVELAFGIVSLALTLPGLLLFVLLELNGRVMHWTSIPKAMEAVSDLCIALVIVLPFFGFCAGIIGRRLMLGKLGIAASVLHYGYVLVGFWRDTL